MAQVMAHAPLEQAAMIKKEELMVDPGAAAVATKAQAAAQVRLPMIIYCSHCDEKRVLESCNCCM
jgi:hypothetical protein